MLVAAGICEIGFGRKDNQDAMICEPERGLFAVIDGVGGCSDGRLAAEILRDTLLEYCEDEPNADTLIAAYNMAHRKMRARIKSGVIDSLQTCGTVIWVSPETGIGFVAHVGDTRLMKREFSGIVRLTRDQSTTGHLPDEEAWQYQSYLACAVGADDFLQKQALIIEIELELNELYLLATDGLHGFALAQRIEQVVFADDPVDKAVRSAYHVGLDGQRENFYKGDNITVVAIRRVS